MEHEVLKANHRSNLLLNYLTNNKKFILTLIVALFLLLISIFVYNKIKLDKNIKTSEEYNSTVILINQGKNKDAKISLLKIINYKNKFYSPLSINLLIENNLENDMNKLKKLYDIVINIPGLDKEYKNLLKFKKTLILMKSGEEIEILTELKEIINSDSVWKSSALDLIKKYYLSKGENKKYKEFEKLLEKNQ